MIYGVRHSRIEMRFCHGYDSRKEKIFASFRKKCGSVCLPMMPETFASTPETYALRPGEVHVWKTQLASANVDLDAMADFLSRAERERAARFTFEREQARFISCRARLRLLLSRYVGGAPEKIVFRYEPQGKPMLAGSGVAGWQFNLSHSRDLAIMAFSRYDPVGIDLELIDSKFPRGEVAPDILEADELRELSEVPSREQAAYFFQIWTMKEALLKAVGKGFSLDPKTIRMRLDAELNPEIVSAPPDLNGASLHRLSIQKEFAAALAVLAGVSRIDFFNL